VVRPLDSAIGGPRGRRAWCVFRRAWCVLRRASCVVRSDTGGRTKPGLPSKYRRSVV